MGTGAFYVSFGKQGAELENCLEPQGPGQKGSGCHKGPYGMLSNSKAFIAQV